jgi:hypothetical protein
MIEPILTYVMLSLAPICTESVCEPVPMVARPVAFMDEGLMLRPHMDPILVDEAPPCESCGAVPSVVVPEPSSYALLGAGVVVLGVLARRRRT